MDDSPLLLTAEPEHIHVWEEVRQVAGHDIIDIRCITCGLEALKIRRRIYRTLKQLELALRAEE